ncbi:MAG: hypothetical protein M3238_04550, partial [Actinomycetota bacterium]|nr:hypothetical protein [Actinomycetota bacterium]
MSTFADMVVDRKRRLVYVSSGSFESLVYLDLKGNIRGSFEDLVAPGAMVIRGDLMYVLDGAAIQVIDLSTKTAVDRYDLPTRAAPTHLVEMDGRLWFSVGCERFQAALASIDLNTGLYREHDFDGHGSCYGLTRASRAPGFLIVWELNTYPGTVYEIDVTLPVVQKVAQFRPEYGANDITVSPDGTRVYIPGSGVEVYERPGYRLVGKYTAGWSVAAALSQDGNLLLASGREWEDDVRVFRVGRSRPLRKYELTAAHARPHGIEFHPDEK